MSMPSTGSTGFISIIPAKSRPVPILFLTVYGKEGARRLCDLVSQTFDLPRASWPATPGCRGLGRARNVRLRG